MKSSIYSKSLLLLAFILIPLLSCYAQDNPLEQVVGTWVKSSGQGTVKFIISSDKKYEVRFTGGEEADVWGSFEIAGKEITFTDEGGQYSSDSSGKYEFEVKDGSLSFTIVDDPVDGRSMLVQGSWSKAPSAE